MKLIYTLKNAKSSRDFVLEVKIAIFHSHTAKKSCEQREVEVEKEKDNFDWEVNVFITGAQ